MEDPQRIEALPKESGVLAGKPADVALLNPEGQVHRGGQSCPESDQLLKDRPDAGGITGVEIVFGLWCSRLVWPASQVVVGSAAVECLVVVHGPDDRQMVSHLGRFRHEFADVDSRHTAGDRVEFSACGTCRLGFHVEGLLLRRTSGDVKKNAGSGGGCRLQGRTVGLVGEEGQGSQSRAGPDHLSSTQAAGFLLLTRHGATRRSAGSGNGCRGRAPRLQVLQRRRP